MKDSVLATPPLKTRPNSSEPPKESIPKEVPQNGIAGLKHWRYDILSGLTVAMISLPFSMGIAITSGAPPVCGIVSAIIAGFLLPFLGGSYVTVSGPAAGLAPAIYSGIIMLGTAKLGSSVSQDALLETGYPLILVAISIAGVLQVILSKMKVARLCAIFPAAAIEGMLAAIGLMIIVKQFPLLFGQKFEAHEFWEILAEVPHKISTINPNVLGLGIACIAALFALSSLPWKFFKVVPPPVWIFFLGTIASLTMISVGDENRITIPASPLANGVAFPAFGEVFSMPSIWLPLFYVVFLLLLIDGTESLATIMAVDKLDPYHRRSDPDRTLQAMGVSNVASSMFGGLTIIPGIVKSTANVMGGGRTQWATFYNATFLLLMLVFARDWINLVPKVVLASILVFVGFKLCRPKVWFDMAKIGPEQFLIFASTVIVTVTTDLLLGIIFGVLLKLVLNVWYVGLAARLNKVNGRSTGTLWQRVTGLFRNPVSRREFDSGVYDLYLERPLVCFNLFHVIGELQTLPAGTKSIRMHFSPLVTIVDHTTVETLFHYLHDYSSRDLTMELVDWNRFRPLSDHPHATQLGLSGELIESEPPVVKTCA